MSPSPFKGEGRDGGERVNDPQSPAPDPHPGPPPERKSEDGPEPRAGALPERAREDAPVVRLEEIVKSYRRGVQTVPVLAGITFDIAAGEFLALMGPSGSGKSTLLNLIAGIDRPDSGRLMVAGTDIGRLTEQELADWRSRNIGFIFQFYNLMPVLDALENVELPLLLTGLSRRQRRERARMALDMVSLSDRLDHFPSELSGGQQQRVAIARALVTDPTLIVADEPTGDLDRESANDVLGMLERLNQQIGKTIIMVTHDQRAAQHAHAIMHLEKGELSQREELAAS
ncbi:MAG: ABC transporter ATP-binding protein [Sterolibacteriaceae bacterium]|nr:ABC transporter ATP-binding protein [Sterolibacteriaceae bacterium]MBK9085980.1 ABC transporter ATP-binding protein [Sterolibacteriaceae bacterium]